MVLIMSIDSKDSDFIYVPEIDLVACPVIDICELPKHNFLCKVPDCKVSCSEYLSKVKKFEQQR